MPPTSRFVCASKDDLVWEKLDEATEQWEKSIRKSDVYRAAAEFIVKHTDKKSEGDLMHIVRKGSFNTVYRLEYKDGSSVIMRIPIQGVVHFPDEKVQYEVATMRYVAAHTTIPVPHIYHHGTAAENPTGLGAFIIMDYIEHEETISCALHDPEAPIEQRHTLNPNIDEDKLECLYGQMANILLQLSTLTFPRIGSLVEDPGDKSIAVGGRPLTWNMNDIVAHTNSPASTLPPSSQTYNTSQDWYSALSDMQLIQLAFQRNDAVENEDEAKDKYVARQLLRSLASEKRLVSDESAMNGDFRLYSEDFRPSNVLIDKDLRVVGVIDWEFAYAAPAQFSFDPPWWLLIREPENWPGGMRLWLKLCEPRMQTFLRMLEKEEEKQEKKKEEEEEEESDAADLAEGLKGLSLAGDSSSKPQRRLSQRMRESWETGTWTLNYAAKRSDGFDWLWWKFLDERYFGENEDQDCKPRIELLTKPQRDVMERFVARKMEEKKERKIDVWTDEEAAALLAEVLV